jgi:ferritin-like metal-binding protein YciE
MKELKTFEDLLIHCITDLYSAEKQLTKAIPNMAEAATDEDLKEGFEDHLTETEEHVKRLEEIIDSFAYEIDTSMTCKGIEGLIDEGKEVLKMDADSDVLDAALIGAASKVEHYEIAAYTTAITLAKKLGMDDIAEILQETLGEEGAMAKKLEMMGEEMPEEIV